MLAWLKENKKIVKQTLVMFKKQVYKLSRLSPIVWRGHNITFLPIKACCDHSMAWKEISNKCGGYFRCYRT